MLQAVELSWFLHDTVARALRERVCSGKASVARKNAGLVCLSRVGERKSGRGLRSVHDAGHAYLLRVSAVAKERVGLRAVSTHCEGRCSALGAGPVCHSKSYWRSRVLNGHLSGIEKASVEPSRAPTRRTGRLRGQSTRKAVDRPWLHEVLGYLSQVARQLVHVG